MLIRVLGSAAGGGFPQWNCACKNCAAMRAGALRSKPRSQAQLAISGDGRDWFLLGASPDLRWQLESSPGLVPSSASVCDHRASPIAGVVLLSAELDHVVGLLTLRERQPLRIYATSSVGKLLVEENSFFRMLEREPGQSQWEIVRPGDRFMLRSPAGKECGITCTSIGVSGKFPFFANAEKRSDLAPDEAVLGLLLEDSAGHKAFYAAGLGRLTSELRALLGSCDLLLMDGSFWSDNELVDAAGKGQTAREMGHLPLSGADGLLHELAGLNCPRKILIHINNTNPILDEASDERRQTMAAGWEVAEDGLAIEL